MRVTLQTLKEQAVEKIVDLWRQKDVEAIKEDFRKVGTVLLGGGVIGVIIGADRITLMEGLMRFVTGLILWIHGIQQ